MNGTKTSKQAPVAQADPQGAAARPAMPRTLSGPPVFSWPAPARPPGDRPQRRRPGQDLIGELFETMHELHFLPDLVTGCDFVLAVVEYVVPCAAVMVHVFDIDARQFVTVRASGRGADKLVLYRTPNTDPLLAAVMRQGSACRIDQAQGDARFTGGRWALLGVAPEAALAVPMAQAGRYLGALELVNPDGGGGFHQNEAHGLEYIAEQFAEFLATRPIVLDPDVVRPRA